jgi:hypothetical protein
MEHPDGTPMEPRRKGEGREDGRPMEGRWKVLFGRWKGDGIVVVAAPTYACLSTAVSLVRSRALSARGSVAPGANVMAPPFSGAWGCPRFSSLSLPPPDWLTEPTIACPPVWMCTCSKLGYVPLSQTGAKLRFEMLAPAMSVVRP